MKLTAILLLIACLHVSAGGYSQKISLSERNSPLEKVFADIQRQSGYDFFFNYTWLDKANKVTVEIHDATLEQALEVCFKGQPFTYEIVKKTVVVKQKEEGKNNSSLTRAPIDVKGKVVNEKGEPLIGASVQVKGSGKGVETAKDGSFELKQVAADAVLVISFTGYRKQEIKLNGKDFISVILAIFTNSLDDVQIIGYGTTSKRFNTGNVSTVTAETIAEQPVSNPLAALEGRVSGFFIQQQTGTPGSGFDLKLRGTNSIANGNQPFYIIDGVPYISEPLSENSNSAPIIQSSNPLNYINPADIERIDILKDADATAIYGSRGANGVILITTKKGKPGQTKVDINLYSGAGKVTRMMDLLSTQQYVQMRREAIFNDYGIDTLTADYASYFPDLLVWDTTRYTNWQKELIGGMANTTDAQVSISGGNSNTQFLIGGGYHRETTVFPGNFADQKGSAHFNVIHLSPNGKFKVNFSANYIEDNNHLPEFDLTSIALLLPPNTPALTDSNGNVNWSGNYFFRDNNQPAALLRQKYNGNTGNLIANANLNYTILPGLQIRTSAGFTTTTIKEITTQPKSSLKYPNEQATSIFSSNSIKTWIIEPQVEYQRKIGNGRLSFLAGTTFQQNIREGQSLIGYGFSSDALLENIQAAQQIFINTVKYTQYKYNAIFGRLNYNWKDKYILNLTARRDGSSRFGPDRRFANFGAIGAGWIFSEEKFIKNNLTVLSFGKIRASYGTTGNDQIGDYKYLSTWSPTTYPYQVSGLYPTGLTNPDYSWEVNKKIETALEMGLLKDKIFLSLSYYHNRSSNQLVGYSLPPTTGFGTVQYNLPAVVQNTGWEFELNSIVLKSKNFSWTSSVNLTIPRNKLISYPNIAGSPYANVYTVGRSLYARKLFHYTGVDPQKGIYTFQDVDKDGQITYPNDLISVKEIAQDFFGGFQNRFQYKGFQLIIFFQFVKQTGANYLGSFAPAAGFIRNEPSIIMNRWQKPGDKTDIQKFTTTTSSDAFAAWSRTYNSGDNIISDASFIRLKNVSLSYQLPEAWRQKIHLQNCRIYLQGQNLLTITKYLGMDPEAGYVQNLPPLRMLTTGIQFTF
jgi:TonB-linked SusC/RagA family outer membrane protein